MIEGMRQTVAGEYIYRAQDPTDLIPLPRKPKAKVALRSPLWTCSQGHRTLAHRETCVCGERRP